MLANWIVAGAGAALLASAPAQAQDAALDALIAKAGSDYLSAEQGVGLSIAVLHDGKPAFHPFGAIAKAGPPPTAATAFEIGSIAKTMTGLLLARAVLAGRIKLDDDVRNYLDGAYPKLEFQGEPVRVLHLANMTSALPDNLPDLSALEPDPGRFAHARAIAAYGKAQFLADLRAVGPSARPGANVAHSNLAAQLLIYVLEKAYALPYPELLRREIEAPLGMIPGAGATGYDNAGREAAALPLSGFGQRYSAAAMLRYAALQLDESDPAVKLSHEGTWFTLDRKTWVGLPWIVSALPGGGRQLRYSGGTFGFASVLLLYPERKTAVMLMANKSSETAQGRLTEIGTRIAEALAAK